MTYLVKYSRAAIEDIDRIESDVFAASQSPTITSQYIEDMLDAIEAKKDFPKSAPSLYYDGLFTGYRFIVFKAYIAFFKIEDGVMFINRVLSGKSDYMKTLGYCAFSE